MIINDEAAIARKAAAKVADESQEKFLLSCENEVKDRVHVPRIGDLHTRIGRPMFPADLENRLKRLNSNIIFQNIEGNPTHKRICEMTPEGLRNLAVYENSLMPERSVPKLRVMEVPDPSFTRVDRKDFDKDPTALRPGWRKVTVPWGEATRGWRTVLVRLIQAGAITVTQAETAFGADDTPEWRQHTGKGAYTTPF